MPGLKVLTTKTIKGYCKRAVQACPSSVYGGGVVLKKTSLFKMRLRCLHQLWFGYTWFVPAISASRWIDKVCDNPGKIGTTSEGKRSQTNSTSLGVSEEAVIDAVNVFWACNGRSSGKCADRLPCYCDRNYSCGNVESQFILKMSSEASTKTHLRKGCKLQFKILSASVNKYTR